MWARPAHESVVPLHAVALPVTSIGLVALVLGGGGGGWGGAVCFFRL